MTCGSCRSPIDHIGTSLHARVGGALRANLILAAELDGFASSEPESVTETATSLIALNVVAQWYPSFTRGYFISAGLGGGRLEASTRSLLESGTTSPVGPAFKIGTGYDIIVTSTLAITPFGSFVYVSGGTPSDNTARMNGNVFLIGVQATLH